MPRLVLLTTEPTPDVGAVRDNLADWSGSRLAAVLVSLHPVSGQARSLPESAVDWTWAQDSADEVQVATWSCAVLPAEPPPAPASARARRLQAEDLAQERGKQLWSLLDESTDLDALLVDCDALVALDQGGIRSAYHLARRHRPAIATNGLTPALVELQARA